MITAPRMTSPEELLLCITGDKGEAEGQAGGQHPRQKHG